MSSFFETYCLSTETLTPQSITLFQSTGPQLHVERYDAGLPAVLLIHGGGDGAFVWDLFAPALARRFTTLAVDLRGHGDSGEWSRASSSISRQK
jgi:pimeloyl-ACP methyl ester carboxylesterase